MILNWTKAKLLHYRMKLRKELQQATTEIWQVTYEEVKKEHERRNRK